MENIRINIPTITLMEALLQDLPALTHSEFGVLKTAIVLAIFERGHPSASEILGFIEKHRDLDVRADDVNLRAVRYALLLLQRDSYIQRHVLAEDDVYTIDPRYRQRVEMLYKALHAKLAPKRPSMPEISVEDAIRQQSVSAEVAPSSIVRQRMPEEDTVDNNDSLMTQTIYIPKPEATAVGDTATPATVAIPTAPAGNCIIL